MAIILELNNKKYEKGSYFFSITYVNVFGIVKRDKECFLMSSREDKPSVIISNRTLPRSTHKFIYKFLASKSSYYLR